jgi:hypothetical protein
LTRGTFQDGPETMFQMGMSQMWYLVSVTTNPIIQSNSSNSDKAERHEQQQVTKEFKGEFERLAKIHKNYYK